MLLPLLPLPLPLPLLSVCCMQLPLLQSVRCKHKKVNLPNRC